MLLTLILILACVTPEPEYAADTADSDTAAEVLPAGACHADADCANSESCYSPDEPMCGACQDPERMCESDGECDAGAVCEDYTVECPCEASPSSACVDACADDAGCDADQACDTATGHCLTLRCDVSYTCPTHFGCDASELEGTG